MNYIKFQDENHLLDKKRKDYTDQEWIEELYSFLKGEEIEGVKISRGHKPKMSEKKAFTIIWFLQEHLRILPDHIERCNICGQLFDNWAEGIYWETKGKHYCGCCDYLVPENYDRGK